jgi:hypothetical protein
MSMNETTPDNIVHGAEAIAPHLGRTVKGTYGALESGRVPGARKIAGKWALNLRVYHASFESNVNGEFAAA